MNFDAWLEELCTHREFAGRITAIREIPARKARFADTPKNLHPSVQKMLAARGITRLYTHQAEAFDRAENDENIIVTASTAGGKTLCFLLPILQALHKQGNSRALLLYPTKALAQDQKRVLHEFGAGELFTAETFDGDTPRDQRRRIKQHAQVILSNPDMLHMGILPYHHTWSDFFRNLRYVVLDELHVYRGIFGAHTANVIRRLQRLAHHYGADPTFVCCSATVGNPGEMARQLIGKPCTVIDNDGSPRGRKLFAFWNPPIVDKITGVRRSSNMEAARFFAKLMHCSVRTLVFTLARQQAELILSYTRDLLDNQTAKDAVMSYRGGYLPQERRDIEKRLFTGTLLGVVSTSALELGVDIGGLDAVVMVGYPHSIASTWQQAGRGGRGNDDSLAVLIALDGALHQFVVENPDYIMHTENENVWLNPHNECILASHLLCAAYEMPLEEKDSRYFGPEMTPMLELLEESPYIVRRGRWYWVQSDMYPAAHISLRSISGEIFEIIRQKDGEVLGTMDASSAHRMLHPGAVYLHGGETYLVHELDLERCAATVERKEMDYYTRPLSQTDVFRGETIEERTVSANVRALYTPVTVQSQVVAYEKRRQANEQVLGVVDLNLPVQEFSSKGIWLLPTDAAMRPKNYEMPDPTGALHALEHVLISLLPLAASCDPHDMGGVSYRHHPEIGGPTICLYDGYPGGVGLAQAMMDRMADILKAAITRIGRCPCESGCPGCVQQSWCGNRNRPLDKQGAVVLARLWLGDEGTTPSQP